MYYIRVFSSFIEIALLMSAVNIRLDQGLHVLYPAMNWSYFTLIRRISLAQCRMLKKSTLKNGNGRFLRCGSHVVERYKIFNLLLTSEKLYLDWKQQRD